MYFSVVQDDVYGMEVNESYMALANPVSLGYEYCQGTGSNATHTFTIEKSFPWNHLIVMV